MGVDLSVVYSSSLRPQLHMCSVPPVASVSLGASAFTHMPPLNFIEGEVSGFLSFPSPPPPLTSSSSFTSSSSSFSLTPSSSSFSLISSSFSFSFTSSFSSFSLTSSSSSFSFTSSSSSFSLTSSSSSFSLTSSSSRTKISLCSPGCPQMGHRQALVSSVLKLDAQATTHDLFLNLKCRWLSKISGYRDGLCQHHLEIEFTFQMNHPLIGRAQFIYQVVNLKI